MTDARRVPALVAAALLVFVALLGLVVRGGNAVTRADADLVSWVAGWRTPWLVDLAHGLSLVGSILVAGPLAIAVGVLAAKAGRGRLALLPALALALAAVVGPLVKLVVDRPRPPLELAEIVEHASGYPSGHSAQSAALFLALALVAGVGGRHLRLALGAGAVAALCIGLSRIVLGVHSPTDLLGGWAFGTACLLVAWIVLRPTAGARPPGDPAV